MEGWLIHSFAAALWLVALGIMLGIGYLAAKETEDGDFGALTLLVAAGILAAIAFTLQVLA